MRTLWIKAAAFVLASLVGSQALAQVQPADLEAYQAQQRQQQFNSELNALQGGNRAGSLGSGPTRSAPAPQEGGEDEENPFAQIKPFGASLFDAPVINQRRDGVNPDYRIVPGDRIVLRLWGAVDINEITTVDPQGNMFIPSVGPIKVEGVRSADLLSVVSSSIRNVYTQNVRVYVSVLTATPVGVFVAGPVAYPGQYAGLPSDSVLYYLTLAGGVDEARGSYREIVIKRAGSTLAVVDLYSFLRDGDIPAIRFQDGDVIVVREQGPIVEVAGTARSTFGFELARDTEFGREIVTLSRPRPNTSHVAITGARGGIPFSQYLTLSAFREFSLRDGDMVEFMSDARQDFINIEVLGSHEGPSRYTLAKTATLRDALALIPVDDDRARIDSIYIQRQSVAEAQKEQLIAALQRLEQSVLTAPVKSDGEAAIRASEAELVQRFVEQAKQVEPLGRVVTMDKGKLSNLRLEDGDVIVVPVATDVITINGEVRVPQALVHQPGLSVRDYVEKAGGYTERADENGFMVMRVNGSVDIGDDVTVGPGDQIVVLPEVQTKNLQFAKDLIQILYQIAIGAGVFLAL